MIIVEVVRKHFPKQAEVLSDPRPPSSFRRIKLGGKWLRLLRVELIIADVFAWRWAQILSHGRCGVYCHVCGFGGSHRMRTASLIW